MIHTNFKYTNIQSDPHLEEYFFQKSEKLQRILKDQLARDAEFDFQIEFGKTTMHHQKGPFFYSEINLKMPRGFLRAQITDQDMYHAIDGSIARLERELIKNKKDGKEWLQERLRNLNKFITNRFIKFRGDE